MPVAKKPEHVCFNCNAEIKDAKRIREEIEAAAQQKAKEHGVEIDGIKFVLNCGESPCKHIWDTRIGAHFAALGRKTGFYAARGGSQAN